MPGFSIQDLTVDEAVIESAIYNYGSSSSSDLPPGNNSGDYVYYTGTQWVTGGDNITIGTNAGNGLQGSYAVALGYSSGYYAQGTYSTAIGYNSGYYGQQENAVAIGYNAGYGAQGSYSVAIGNVAGNNNQGDNSVAIGCIAGSNSQASGAVAVGFGAGYIEQGEGSIAMGFGAGVFGQGNDSIAVGALSGFIEQGEKAVAIGYYAGYTGQGQYGIALGCEASCTGQGYGATSIGYQAGGYNQSSGAIAIGYQAGQNNQGNYTEYYSSYYSIPSIAIGYQAGQNNQGKSEYYGYYGSSIALGDQAGQNNQTVASIAIGCQAGNTDQQLDSIAIGFQAGYTNQGTFSIAIGLQAGQTDQHQQTIVLNGSGTILNTQTQLACYVNPIREITNPAVDTGYNYNMVYNSSNSEVARTPNLIYRANPGSGSPLLLSSFNTVHYYTGSGTTFAISTGMVVNGVYEVKFNCFGSTAANDDLLLTPNVSVSGSNIFYTTYQSVTTVPALQYSASSNSGGFTFDFVGGALGRDPVGKITIYNNTNAKKIRIEAGDTTSVVTGTGYWLTSAYTPSITTPPPYNTATAWTSVGSLSFGTQSFTSWVIWVTRVG